MRPLALSILPLVVLAAGCGRKNPPAVAQSDGDTPPSKKAPADGGANKPDDGGGFGFDIAAALQGKSDQKTAPAQPAPAKGGNPNALEPADLGEEVLRPDLAPGDAPLRPAKGMPLYKLTNLRIGNPGPGPWPKLMVHYERVSGEERGTGPSLVIRTKSGNESNTIGGFGPFAGQRKAGDFVVDLGFGGGPRAGGTPKDLEVYLVHNDHRWSNEGLKARFKVSNSVTMGDMGRPPQYAREWNATEVAKFNDPPPAAPSPNLHRNVGEDTDFAGDRTDGVPVRYVDPDKRPLLGFDYRVGESDIGGKDKAKEKTKEKAVQQLGPVYDTRQSLSPVFERVIAKKGYAVGGATVKTKNLVNAIQLTFMRLKPDGTLDPKDSYASKWIGFPDAGEKETKLAGDGRTVIGFHMRHFGTTYTFALVVD